MPLITAASTGLPDEDCFQARCLAKSVRDQLLRLLSLIKAGVPGGRQEGKNKMSNESKRVYVHYEGQPEYTHVVRIGKDLTFEELAQDFTRAYNGKYGKSASLNPTDMQFFSGRRPMSNSSVVTKFVKDRSDIFVSLTPGDTLTTSPTQEVTSNENGTDLKQGNVVQSEASSAERLSLPDTTASKIDEELNIPLIRSVLGKGLGALQIKRFKLAGTIFREVLQVSPRQKICLRALGAMALELRKYVEAVSWLQQGLLEYPRDALFHARLGDAYSGLGKSQEALHHYDRALGLVVEQQSTVTSSKLDIPTLADPTALLTIGRNHYDVKGISKTDGVKVRNLDDPDAGDLQGAVTVEGLKVACAKVLYETGDEGLASAILLAILKENPGSLDALYEYGIALLRRGLIKDALSVFLKLNIAKLGDKKARRGLSGTIRHPQGLEALKKELASDAVAAPALAYIASFVKDYAAISEAVELYEMAIKLSPSSPGYFLSLIHLYEVAYEYHKCLEKAIFLFRNSSQVSFPCFHYSDVIACIEYSNDHSEDHQLWPTPGSHIGSQYPSWSILPLGDDKDANVGWQQEQERCVSIAVNDTKDGDDRETLCNYNENHLCALAVLFTITKILFLNGFLERANQLARIVETARVASAKPLHQTLIRNEAAYFNCVHQILEDYPILLPLPPIDGSNTLYLAGDSHCLSAAWRKVRFRDKDHVMVPVLVTGLKIWHLRRESDFYPKIAFQNAMKSIPDGSKVVMLYGEIDCREGILLAVEKDIYQDVEEGVEVIVNLYLDTLGRLMIDRGFELFVHPVPPVLNETRSLVHVFNIILEQRLIAYKQANPAIGSGLHWLNFVADLLSAEGTLKEDFQLDGTHLSPNYHYLLRREIEKVK